MAGKTLAVTYGRITMNWSNGEKGMVDVDCHLSEPDGATTILLQWSFPQVCGTSLMGNMLFWSPQAIIYAASKARNLIKRDIELPEKVMSPLLLPALERLKELDKELSAIKGKAASGKPKTLRKDGVVIG